MSKRDEKRAQQAQYAAELAAGLEAGDSVPVIVRRGGSGYDVFLVDGMGMEFWYGFKVAMLIDARWSELNRGFKYTNDTRLLAGLIVNALKEYPTAAEIFSKKFVVL